MNITLSKFEEWLRNKNLKERTIENYIYYFNKFTFDSFDQETISKFLSHKGHRNSISRSFLINLQKYLKVNYKELRISPERRIKISDVELPKLTGRVKQRIIKPIPHDQIPLLEKNLDTERLKLQLLLSYYCALRVGELLKIQIISFNWDAWKKDTSKMGECLVYGKGDKEGIALVPAALMKRMAIYIKSKNFRALDSKLFVRDIKDLNLKNRARSWQLKLRQAGIKAGITKLNEKGRVIDDTAVHPHRLRHCVVEDTEILTINGWKKRKELKIGELCPTLNLKNNKIEFKPVKKIYVYNFNGNLFQIKNKYLDSQITPEHNCILRIDKERQKTINKKRKRWTELGNWELKTINELIAEKNKRVVKYRISGISDGDYSIGKARAGILGWILTDGYIGKRKYKDVLICQSLTANKYKCEIIENLLIKGKIKYSKKIYIQRKNLGFAKKTSKNVVFRILKDNKDWIFNWINYDKTPKYELLLLKQIELKSLYKNMMLGDGTLSRELSTQNKKTIDFFRAMCSLLNYRTLLSTKKQNGKEYFRTYITKRNDCQLNKKNIKQVHYVGKVWCPNIENNTWIAKHKEKIYLTGNSYASYLINVKKLDIREVQDVLRHSDISSTQIYTHIDKEQLKQRLSGDSHSKDSSPKKYKIREEVVEERIKKNKNKFEKVGMIKKHWKSLAIQELLKEMKEKIKKNKNKIPIKELLKEYVECN